MPGSTPTAPLPRRVGEVFEGDFRLRYHLAPPLLARLDPATGHPRKMQFRPWMAAMFRLLAAMKGLRGTFADPFGRTAERRTERQLIDEFERTLDDIGGRLRPENHAFAVELAALPMTIRGFGHVKTATHRGGGQAAGGVDAGVRGGCRRSCRQTRCR